MLVIVCVGPRDFASFIESPLPLRSAPMDLLDIQPITDDRCGFLLKLTLFRTGLT